MTPWLDPLDDALRDAGHTTHQLVCGDGRLLLTQTGARILGCDVADLGRNLFWTPDTMPPAGQIAGGDRLWIAPEVAYYWPSLELARQDPVRHAAMPPAVDPGDYQLVRADERSALVTGRCELTDCRDGRRIAFAVSREITVCDPPLGLPSLVSCAGFAITNTLMIEAPDSDAGAVAGAWDILQIPPTGTLVCPTTADPEVISYYEPFGDRHVAIEPRRVRFLVDGRRRIKMGLDPAVCPGRMAYYQRPAEPGQPASLIVRVFGVLPGEPYVDLPRDADAAERLGGDVLQAYNDDGTFGGFGEMEYHDPALVAGRAPDARTGSCTTHVLVGDDRGVREAGEQLLGVPIDPLD